MVVTLSGERGGSDASGDLFCLLCLCNSEMFNYNQTVLDQLPEVVTGIVLLELLYHGGRNVDLLEIAT